MPRPRCRRVTLPEAVVLRGQTWRVEAAPGLLARTGSHGECVYDERTIRVDTDADAESVEDTLVHELLHAVLAGTGIVRDRTEERLVRAITPAVVEVFRQVRLRGRL